MKFIHVFAKRGDVPCAFFFAGTVLSSYLVLI
jgi:hypothetical protein